MDSLQKIISRESSYDWRKIVLNINMISIVIGVVLFFTRIHLPQLINDTIGSVGSMIGPASMIVTGMLFAGMDLKKVFANRRVYFVTFLRMLLVPLISLILIKISHMAYLSADAPKRLCLLFSWRLLRLRHRLSHRCVRCMAMIQGMPAQ